MATEGMRRNAASIAAATVPGIVHVDAHVGAVVDARHDQVDRALVELHAGEFHAVRRRALDAERR